MGLEQVPQPLAQDFASRARPVQKSLALRALGPLEGFPEQNSFPLVSRVHK